MKIPAAALVMLAVPVAAWPSAEAARAHAQRVSDAVAPHLPRSGPAPQVAVIEKAAPLAAGQGATIEITTGLLAALRSDAELAMILAYEQARLLRPDTRAPGGGGVGRSIGASATTGAATAAVATEVHDSLRGSDRTIRAAATGAAGAATAAAILHAWHRRGNRSSARGDDAAAGDAMRAVIGAGFDGAAALGAWDAIVRATPLGGASGGYGDHGADRRRRSATERVLRQSGQRRTAQSGYVIGESAYASGILAHLSGWRLRRDEPAAPPASPRPGGPPAEPAGARAWLTYERSGGISGEMVRVTVEPDGRVASWSSRRPDAPAATASADEMTRLRASLADVLALPARAGRPELRFLRDGMRRSVTVAADSSVQTVALSDGYELVPADWELIKQLEGWLRLGPEGS